MDGKSEKDGVKGKEASLGGGESALCENKVQGRSSKKSFDWLFFP